MDWSSARVNAALACSACGDAAAAASVSVESSSPLLDAIKAGECPPPAEDDAVLRPAAEAEATVEKLLAGAADGDHPVLLFSKTYCPYCKRAKELLKTLCDFKDVTVLELDTAEEGSVMQAHLVKRTGQSTVPQAFIGGQFIGGYDSLSGLDPEEVATLIAQAVAKWNGHAGL